MPAPQVKAEATPAQDRLRVLITRRGYNYEPVINRFKKDRDWNDVTLKNAAVNLMESPRVEALQLVTCLYWDDPIEGIRQYDHIGTHPETLFTRGLSAGARPCAPRTEIYAGHSVL